MLQKVCVFLLLLVVYPSVLLAAEWMIVGRNGDRSLYIDINTISTSPQGKSFFVKTEYGPVSAKEITKQLKSKDAISYDVVDFTIRCDSKTIAQNTVTYYKKGGMVIGFSDNAYQKFNRIIPDSMGEAFMNAVCK